MIASHVCGDADCRCLGPFVGETIEEACIAATRSEVSRSGLTLSLPRAADEVDAVVVDVDELGDGARRLA